MPTGADYSKGNILSVNICIYDIVTKYKVIKNSKDIIIARLKVDII